MPHVIEERLIPQTIFIKLAGIDRTTFENWTRSGAVAVERVAKESGRTSPYFSIGTLLKVKMMLQFKEQLFIPPRQSAAFADQLLETHADEIGAALAEFMVRMKRITEGATEDSNSVENSITSLPIFSGYFWVDHEAEGGPRLTLSQGAPNPGVIRLLLPLTAWLAETALAFMAFADAMGISLDPLSLQERAP